MSNIIWVYALSSVSIVSLISLMGVFAIPIKRSTLDLVVFLLLSLATGAMLGNAMVNLVPESFENASPTLVWGLVFVGLVFCFMVEKVLNMGCHHSSEGHCRLEHCHCEAEKLCNQGCSSDKTSWVKKAVVAFLPPVVAVASYQGLTALGLDRSYSSAIVIVAVLGFYIVTKARAMMADDHHGHSHSSHTPLAQSSAGHIHVTGWMSLVSHGLDNFMDGVLIAVSYQVSTEVGIATTIAIVLHEIPMEFGGFGVLINAGFSRWGAIAVNFGSALVATSATALTLWLGSQLQGLSVWLTPLCAAIVLNITLSGLMPQLIRETRFKRSLIIAALVLSGVAASAIFAVHLFFPE